MELRIGERRDQKVLEPGVEIGLVPELWARTGEFMALLGGGSGLVCELRTGGLARVDLRDDDLLVRDGEGVHALVERLDQLDVVAPLPGRELPGFIGLRHQEPVASLLRLILQPAPQLFGVDVGIDVRARRPGRRARELVGAHRDLGERAVHHRLDLGHPGAEIGRAVQFVGRLRVLGHLFQSAVDARGAVAEIVAVNRIGRAVEPLEQLHRLRIDLPEVLAQEEVAAKVEVLPVELVPIVERAVGLPEVVPFGPGPGEIERRGRRRNIGAENGVDVGLVHAVGKRAQRVGTEEVEPLIDAGAHERREGVGTHLLDASDVLRIGERHDELLLEISQQIELVLLR